MAGIRDFTMDCFSLAGKNALVTGGNTGLGQAFALALAKGGADVFAPSIIDDDGSTREMIEAEGRRYEFLKTDITAPGVPAEIVDACVERLGSIDILVNSAGINPLADVLDFGRPQWDAAIAVNLTAAFETAYEAARWMIPQHRGKIINVCSVFTYLGGRARRPTRPPSTASPVSPRRTATSSPSTTSRSTGWRRDTARPS